MSKNRLNNFWIITGEVNQGKTTFIKKLVKHLFINNIDCHGIITIAKFNCGKKNNYFVSTLDGSWSKKLCSTNAESNWIKHKRFYFNPSAIQFGNSLLNNIATDPEKYYSKVIIVDEVGQFELNNNGWYNGLNLLVKSRIKNQVWVVRKSLVESVCEKFNISQVQIIDVGEESANELIGKLLHSIGDA